MNPESNPHKQQKLQVIAWLADTFPNAFFVKPQRVKPLKLGIYEDILEFYDRLDNQPYSRKVLKDALKYYSSSPAYLKSQKPHTPRIDIYGNSVEEVTEEQSLYAKKRFEEKYKGASKA